MKFLNILKSFLIGVPIGITFIDTVGYIARVDGISMRPALNPDNHIEDYVFLNCWSVKRYEIKRGDIISLISPKDPSQKIIKRVVGIQGDIIATISYKSHVVKIPEGHCWVEGDHTGHSMDSNNFGPVSLGLVTAKAACIVWPPSRWQIIRSFLPDSLGIKMRAISLVNRIEFQFMGNVARNAITLGDVDNDGCNELIIGNNRGEVSIFKGKETVQKISDLSFVSCIAVGDVFNKKKNSLVILTADGWCYIYNVQEKDAIVSEQHDKLDGDVRETAEQNNLATSTQQNTPVHKNLPNKDNKPLLVCVHIQRIPANAKNIVLGDIDNDGFVEMILGLTDRVVRSYRWLNDAPRRSTSPNEEPNFTCGADNIPYTGRLIALNKWECANQIGSITLHHTSDGKPSLLIAQPGGTFMRVKCQTDESSQNQENLEQSQSSGSDTIPGSAVDYQFLGISRMRNQNISTEILGDFKTENKTNGKEKRSPYAVATLDGTIMLVQNEVILWAIAVDYQIFALTKLDVTKNGSDDIVVCSWDGQTYIFDQDKNCVRFHLDEPVQAFHSGLYNLSINEPAVTCLVYVTFKHNVILYYDIPLNELKSRKYEPDPEILYEFYMKQGKRREEAVDFVQSMSRKTKNELVHYLLNMKKES